MKKKIIALALASDEYQKAVETAARTYKLYCKNRNAYGYYIQFIEECSDIGRTFREALYLSKGDTDVYIANVVGLGVKRRFDKFCAWKVVIDDAQELAKIL